MKKLSYSIPERKVGEVFTYNGNTYKVIDAKGESLFHNKIACTIKDPDTGNIENLCVFAAYCGRVNMRHRGYCTADSRKDRKTVYFEKIKK